MFCLRAFPVPAGVYPTPLCRLGVAVGILSPAFGTGAVGGVVKMSRVGSAALGSGLFQTQCFHSLTMGRLPELSHVAAEIPRWFWTVELRGKNKDAGVWGCFLWSSVVFRTENHLPCPCHRSKETQN